MKILFWVPYPSEGPSNRYRVEQYLPYLRNNGIRYSLRNFWSKSAYKILYKKGYFLIKTFFFIRGTMLRILDVLCIFRYDLVFIHREAYPVGGFLFEMFLTLLKKPFIFDFDDAIFLPASSMPNNFVERFRNPDKIAKIIKRARHVIAGNSYLADFALRFNKSVRVIPTPIDTENYYPLTKVTAEKVTIGWMGSATTLSFVYMMEGVFRRLSEKFSNLEFMVVGGRFYLPGLNNISSKPWNYGEEKDTLAAFDIGIMPMSNNVWTRGKCGFKAILYMSSGIPCVCSAVGMNKEIIVDGINGYLADTEDEWAEKLSLLIDSQQLREKIGAAGRRTVEEKYSVQVNAPKFIEILIGGRNVNCDS